MYFIEANVLTSSICSFDVNNLVIGRQHSGKVSVKAGLAWVNKGFTNLKNKWPT